MNRRKRQQWQKVLYINQEYPDNYVNELFLNELCKNSSVELYDFRTLFLLLSAVIQHICTIIMFGSIFAYVYFEKMSASQLILLANSFTFIGYAIWMIYVRIQGNQFKYEGKQTAKSAILFLMILLGMSPILKTLTEDTSSDSIWALSALCFFLNCLFNDYSSKASDGKFPTNAAIALNAAMFGSVILASRLATKAHVFGLLSLGVNWFGLFPIFRRYLRSNMPLALDMLVTICLVMMSAFMLHHISSLIAYTFLVIIILSWILCPSYFVYMQRYKNEIKGPWDEASLHILKQE